MKKHERIVVALTESDFRASDTPDDLRAMGERNRRGQLTPDERERFLDQMTELADALAAQKKRGGDAA